MFISIVPDNWIRAQLFFKFDEKSKKVVVYDRYIPFDPEQESRLNKLFYQIINPKLKLEQLASMLASDQMSSDDEMMRLPEG